MRPMSRRGLLAVAAGAAMAAVAGCSTTTGSNNKDGHTPDGSGPIGDGSTSDTGAQPFQPTAERLQPGQTPPQFVIFSWDGAGELDNGLFARFRKLAHEHNVKMTFFLSGLYCLPESKKQLYHPPNNPVGASAIGYFSDKHIKMTLEQIRLAWLEGHEIGTHFNGHFLDGPGSVARWTPAQWESEIRQAIDFVTKWKTNTRFTDVKTLPFDYHKELVGGRTPGLLGQKNWLPTAKKMGFRYDASSPGGRQIWPAKQHDIWDLPLQLMPFPGHKFEVLSMDYNILANQAKTTKGDPRRYAAWRKQATAAYVGGFQRAYETNRAPFYIGNHFEEWNGGIYMDAVEDTLKYISSLGKKDVRMVSFKQYVNWLDAQDPKLISKLRTLNVGEKPREGWQEFTSSA
ncbi:hypothetical protein ACIGW8_34195 [Streptomyces sioyaensis]|uniref:hypothetical protein n=1 Tax=Streptomyces sioyaensis TaxID=67364 RepID=UPI0037D4795B